MIRATEITPRLWTIMIMVLYVLTSCSKMAHREVTSKADLQEHSSEALKPGSTDRNQRIENLTIDKLAEIKDAERPDSPTLKTSADRIIETAMEYLGTPHCMGGTTSRCLDCSGFVMIVFAEYGINLPHNAHEQSKHGTIIKEKKDLIKGDLVFFHGSYNAGRYITHSGIYIGNNKFIHTSTGKGVTITSLDDTWWKGKFTFGARLLNR